MSYSKNLKSLLWECSTLWSSLNICFREKTLTITNSYWVPSAKEFLIPRKQFLIHSMRVHSVILFVLIFSTHGSVQPNKLEKSESSELLITCFPKKNKFQIFTNVLTNPNKSRLFIFYYFTCYKNNMPGLFVFLLEFFVRKFVKFQNLFFLFSLKHVVSRT